VGFELDGTTEFKLLSVERWFAVLTIAYWLDYPIHLCGFAREEFPGLVHVDHFVFILNR
jgi:hypothetical protein